MATVRPGPRAREIGLHRGEVCVWDVTLAEESCSAAVVAEIVPAVKKDKV